MLLFSKKVSKGILEDVIYHNPNTQDKHGHVKSCEDLLPCIFIVKICLNLRHLNEQ